MSRGEMSSGKQSRRHPLDWCVEEGWEWEQIAAEIGLEVEIEAGCTIWDPACGYGHCLSRLQGIGFKGELAASDLVNNLAWTDFAHPGRVSFTQANFIADFKPERAKKPTSIWMNPPFSYDKKPWLELFCRQALAIATHRVVAIAPLKWLDPGKKRSAFFRRDFPPQQVLHFSSRPSMPPGDMIEALGEKAYSGGQISYCAVVWDVRYPTAPRETRSVWLPPLGGC